MAFAIAAVAFAASCKSAAPGLTESEWNTKHSYPNCAFTAGQLAKDTLPAGYPTGTDIPIDHIVLVMHENRSFDHYLGGLPGADVAPATASNPDPSNDNQPVVRFHQTSLCFADTNHEWSGQHQAYDNGAMDGFVAANEPDGARAMGYYDQTDLPFFYSLAESFAVSDRHFCSLMGPTFPNRMFYEAATSFGITTSSGLAPPDDPQGNPYPNIMTEMDAAGVNWQAYIQDIPAELLFGATYSADQERFSSYQLFLDDAYMGNLPDVALVEASDGSSQYPLPPDEHPPADPNIGQTILHDIVEAVMNSPQWASTAIIITYDENGGLYDHVQPPMACEPDNLQPITGGFAFNQLGFRVPLIVVSPYAKRGYVSHHITDHTSITRFVEARFNLPAMTKRDANAEPLFDLFDFSHPDLTVANLPDPTINATVDQQCIAEYGTNGGIF